MTAQIIAIGTTPALVLGAIILVEVGFGVFLLLASAASRVIMKVTAIFLFAMAALFGYFTYGAFYSTVTIDTGNLHVNVPIYSQTIPLESIDAELSKVVDLNQSSEFNLSIRTNGLGVPGYQLGWFERASGGQIYAVLTDRSSVVYLPTTEGYALLLSIEEPDAFLKELGRS